jgi:hypothetical protein
MGRRSRWTLGPVKTTGVDGVADENRARTGPPRTALGPWGGEPGPHGQLLVRGVETRRKKALFRVEFGGDGVGAEAPSLILNSLWHPSTALRAGYEVVLLRTSASRWGFSASCEVVLLRTSASRWGFSASCEVVPFHTSTSNPRFVSKLRWEAMIASHLFL